MQHGECRQVWRSSVWKITQYILLRLYGPSSRERWSGLKHRGSWHKCDTCNSPAELGRVPFTWRSTAKESTWSKTFRDCENRVWTYGYTSPLDALRVLIQHPFEFPLELSRLFRSINSLPQPLSAKTLYLHHRKQPFRGWQVWSHWWFSRNWVTIFSASVFLWEFFGRNLSGDADLRRDCPFHTSKSSSGSTSLQLLIVRHVCLCHLLYIKKGARHDLRKKKI